MEKNILGQTLRKRISSLFKNEPLPKIIFKTLFLIVLFTLGTAYVWLILRPFSYLVASFLSNVVSLFFKGTITNNPAFFGFMFESLLFYTEIFCYFIFFIFVSKILSRHRSIEIAKNLFISIIIIGILMTITSFIYIEYIGNGVINPNKNYGTWFYNLHPLSYWKHRLLGPNAVYFYDIPSTMKVKNFLFTLFNFYPMLVFLTKYLCSKKYFYLLGAFGWWLNSSVVAIIGSESDGLFSYPFFE